MKSKIILAVVALLCTFTLSAEAQGRHGRGNGYGNRGNHHGANYAYHNGYGGGYRNNCAPVRPRGYYRPRPAAYCQPVVIAPRPRYYAPRYAYGPRYVRPRVNINIGF